MNNELKLGNIIWQMLKNITRNCFLVIHFYFFKKIIFQNLALYIARYQSRPISSLILQEFAKRIVAMDLPISQ
jgi:hypothetical protein